MSRILAVVILAAYALISLGPRGAMLCLGGGHDWNEIIAAGCAHGSHSHGCPDNDDHSHKLCDGCEHHHDNEHGPCTDIPLGVDESRPRLGQPDLKHALSCGPASMAVAVHATAAELPLAFPRRVVCRSRDSTWATEQVMASLRAVILLI